MTPKAKRGGRVIYINESDLSVVIAEMARINETSLDSAYAKQGHRIVKKLRLFAKGGSVLRINRRAGRVKRT